MSDKLKDALREAVKAQVEKVENSTLIMPHTHGMILAFEMVMDFMEGRTAPLLSLSGEVRRG